MKTSTLLLLFLFMVPICAFIAEFSDVCGNYYGAKDDYDTEIKLYDDSVFKYTGRREFPFEISEGTWTLNGDTVILNSVACKDPEALNHIPIRKYVTITNAKYLFRKDALIPIAGNKQVKSEMLQKEK